jgi:hypothetical protein
VPYDGACASPPLYRLKLEKTEEPSRMETSEFQSVSFGFKGSGLGTRLAYWDRVDS